MPSSPPPVRTGGSKQVDALGITAAEVKVPYCYKLDFVWLLSTGLFGTLGWARGLARTVTPLGRVAHTSVLTTPATSKVGE